MAAGTAAAYLMTAMVSPLATEPPSDTPSCSMVPADGAVISFSIFMASITQIRAPSSTWRALLDRHLEHGALHRRDERPGGSAAAARALALALVAPGGPPRRPAPLAPLAPASPITVTSKRLPDTSTA